MNRSINHRLASTLLVAGFLLGLTACKTTRQVSAEHTETSGFLSDYSQLQPGWKGQATLVWIDPTADWGKYTKVKIEPVQLWEADDPESALGKLPPEDQRMLVDTFYDALRDHLSKDYQITDQGGPDVLVARAAITEAKKCHPVANLVSSVSVALHVVSLGKRLGTGTDLAVGKATVEVELLDGQSKQRVGATVDRRAGTRAIQTKFNSTWGDVKLAFDAGSQQLQTRLAEQRRGTSARTSTEAR